MVYSRHHLQNQGAESTIYWNKPG